MSNVGRPWDRDPEDLAPCPHCDGTRTEPGSQTWSDPTGEPCGECGGSGVVPIEVAAEYMLHEPDEPVGFTEPTAATAAEVVKAISRVPGVAGATAEANGNTITVRAAMHTPIESVAIDFEVGSEVEP